MKLEPPRPVGRDLVALSHTGRLAVACKHLFLVFTRSQDRIRNGLIFLATSEGERARTGVRRLASTPSGGLLLATTPDLAQRLGDHAQLAALPIDSVGRAYLTFMSRHGLSEDAYMAAVVEIAQRRSRSPEDTWFRVREGRLHDLRHVVTGYGTDELGEVCLLAFRSAQTSHPGMTLLTGLAVLRLLFTGPRRRGPGAVAEAYSRGRMAIWLDSVDWETWLGDSLDLVRIRLHLPPPHRYPDAAGERTFPATSAG